jgi:eukaryotic-like serine/threonine-protein kinase
MQIKCPECESVMSVGAIKPGRYQPKCKKCGKPFIVLVEGDPPKVRVGKLKPAPAVAATPSRASTDATIDGSRPSQPVNATATVTAVDATLDVDATQLPSGKTFAEASTDNKPVLTVRQGGSRASGSADRSDDMSVAAKQPGTMTELPERLGGYRILRLLGRGAMGAVYEAKQLSLDRNVALKTIRGRIADNPSTLARFTREAYAAAQLVHHNVVQIYDFGQDSGQHFFSMEWVRGGPLSDLVRNHGPVDPRVAATYTLQAARGLQFAHRHGMVHRDVKPANLLLNEEGVVKVADLGLVKVPDQPDPQSDVGAASAASGMASGTQVTMMGTAVGTPAYMAPEQSLDSTNVDHRADIYSLGCSLFYLLAGKPPFDGQQVPVVMKQHAEAPIPKVQSINPRVPEQLSVIIEQAMAKRPDDRYSSIAEMISDLETFLGLPSGQMFSPTSQQADQWESLAKAYAAVPLAKAQQPAMLGILAIAVVLLLATPLLGFKYLLLGPSVLFASLAVSLMLGTRLGEDVIATRIRSWLGSLSWSDYLIGAAVALVVLLVSMLTGLAIGLFIGILLGAILGAAYHFGVNAPLHASRQATLLEAEKFIRDLRIQGIDEERIRDFGARYSGRQWKPLFEAIFGYEAMLVARERLRADAVTKAIAGGRTMRDAVCGWLMRKTEQNRLARDHKRLAKLEEKGLQSEGMSAAEAKERAWQIASALIDSSKVDPEYTLVPIDQKMEADKRRNRMKAMLADARSGKYAKKRDKLAPLRMALGPKMRLLAGCLLLLVFGLWIYRSDAFNPETIQKLQDTATGGNFNANALQSFQQQIQAADLPKLLGTHGFAVGIAGLMMALSAFISGWRMSLFAIPAIAIAIVGPHLGIPDVGPVAAWAVSCAAAFVLMIPGAIVSESENTEY